MASQPTQPSGTNGTQTPSQPTQPPNNAQALKQNVTDITNAVIAVLKAVGVNNTQDLQPLGAAIGLAVGIAEMATMNPVGIAAGVASVVSSIISILSPSSQANPDAAVLANIQQTLKSMQQSEAATNLGIRLQGIQGDLANAYTSLDNLTALIKGPSLTKAEITTALTPVLTALGNMAPPDVFQSGCSQAGQQGTTWYPPYAYQVYWDDTGATFAGGRVVEPYGPQNPSNYQSAGNTVFNYTCILPQYLSVISIFLAVGAAIDQAFVADYTLELKSIICLLQSVYGYIYNNGLKQLTPGAVTYETLTGWVNWLNSANFSTTVPGVSGTSTSLEDDATSAVLLEYGVVELFSGYSSVAILTLDVPFDSGFPYSTLFQIRQLKRWKDVYIGTGLLALSNMINTLNGLFQKPPVLVGPQPPPSLADWSFSRDIRPTGIARSDGTIHVSDLMALLSSQYLPASSFGQLRAVLDFSVSVTA